MERRGREDLSRGGAVPALLFALLTACGAPSEPVPEATTAAPGPAAAPTAATSLDPDDPTLLRRPFTVEELRGEWVEGLSLKLRRTTSTGEVRERWTVVTADAAGVEIEFATLAEGEEAAEASIQRSTWEELRDHASFAADRSTVEETTLETALGTLDGWLYTVRDEPAGTVTELFFARDLPGAPVRVRMLKDGALLMELEQIERSRPARTADP